MCLKSKILFGFGKKKKADNDSSASHTHEKIEYSEEMQGLADEFNISVVRVYQLTEGGHPHTPNEAGVYAELQKKRSHQEVMKKICLLIVVLITTFGVAWADRVSSSVQSPNDTSTVLKDSNDVVMSICTATPGTVLYSCVGHAFFRAQCPKYNLDYCYSYEGEDVEHQILAFFAGKLKMGMFCIPTKEYLQMYANDHRGVEQYDLNLPLDAKQRICKILDERVSQGANLPYDYLQRGCAQTCLQIINEAVAGDSIHYAPWPDKYSLTVRELFVDNVSKYYPWTLLELQTIGGTAADHECNPQYKIVIPADLIDILSKATINGIPLLSSAPKTLLSGGEEAKEPWFTPMMASGLILLLVLVGWITRKPYADWLVLGIQFILGVFLAYLVFISSLPCTEWNWLIIPFNPLPIILYRWKRFWCPVYAAVLAVWVIVMLVYPHHLTDNAYILFAVSLIIINLKQLKTTNHLKFKTK